MKKANLLNTYQLFIGGTWSNASDGKTSTSYCPATGEKLASYAEATKEDVDRAVNAAWKAWDSWKRTTKEQRYTILNAIADIIDKNKEHLALVESMDNGKPIRETLAIDIPFSAEHFRYFAAAVLAEEGKANIHTGDQLSIILHEPIGVVGQIIPWNFPMLMAAWKLWATPLYL